MPTVTEDKVQSFRMINVGEKQTTLRRAVAQGCIYVGKKVFDLIEARQLPKGDAIALAEIAGIMAAKKTVDLIPLCHPLPLDHVSVKTEMNAKENKIIIYCEVVTSAKTGVEMEALTGVNVALLTIYDLSKMIESTLRISDIKLLIKTGGKQGVWMHPDGIPTWLMPNEKKHQPLKNIQTSVTTVSDRASSGEYVDESGSLLQNAVAELGGSIVSKGLVSDNKNLIAQHIHSVVNKHSPQLFILTGGTGMGPKDVTPDALQQVCDRMLPSIGELLRHDSAHYYTRYAWLSRCTGGVLNNTLIITLPGRPKAVKEGMQILADLLPHALLMVNGGNHD